MKISELACFQPLLSPPVRSYFPAPRRTSPFPRHRRCLIGTIIESSAPPFVPRSSSFRLFGTREDQNDDNNTENETPLDDKDEELFLRNSLAKLESLEDVLDELEDYNELLLEEVDENDDLDEVLWDEESLAELLSSIPYDESDEKETKDVHHGKDSLKEGHKMHANAAAGLENALLQGVVPVSAGVGSECLPGDWGWDPLDLSSKDYFRATQNFLLNLIPKRKDQSLGPAPQSMSYDTKRPKALILRDYREAEIRHGRLAMLAAVFWPLQEMLDRLLLDEDQFGPLIYGPVTLPYFPLIMTAIMLLLGYLDIYSQAIKDMDRIGEAFLPGDCFWDPLRILDGAPDRMKRNMQERELFNGRVAMIAVAVYIWEEGITHLPLISIPGNEILLEPAYQVPFIQKWLDSQFAVTDSESAFLTPSTVETVEEQLKATLDELADAALQ